MVFNLTYNPEGKEYISNNSLPSDSKTGEDKYGLTDQQYELLKDVVIEIIEKDNNDYNVNAVMKCVTGIRDHIKENEIIKEAAVNGEKDAFSHVYFDVIKNEEAKQLVKKDEIPDDLVKNERTLKRVFGIFEKEVYDYFATSA